jgi:hypothetical protein
MTTRRKLNPKLGRNNATAAVGGVAGDANLHGCDLNP